MARNIIQWAQSVYEKYAAQISRLLGVPVEEVTFVLIPSLVRPAETVGTEIRLSPEWFREHPDDVGAIIHEMAHAFQQVPAGGAAPHRIEAMADYVRAKLAPGEGWQPNEAVQRLLGMSVEEVRRLSQNISSTDYEVPSGENQNTGSTVSWAWIDNQYGAAVTGAGNNGGIDFDPGDFSGLFPSTGDQYKPPFYKTLIQELGIPISSNLQALIQEAAKKDWNTTTFLYWLRQTPEYSQSFPGILNADGSLKMTEAQYLSNVAQYESYAVQFGLPMNSQRLAWLFSNNVSPTEYALKGQAVSRVQRNPELYQAFRREAIQGGIASPQDLDEKGLLRFAAGLGNPQWFDLWQDTLTRYTAIEAGIAIKRGALKEGAPYASLPQGLIEKLSGKGLSEEAMTAGFQQLAEHLLTTLPLSKIQNYNLSKKQLTSAIFGGKNQAEIRQKILRVARHEAAFYEDRVSAGLQAGPQGGIQLAGRQPAAESA